MGVREVREWWGARSSGVVHSCDHAIYIGCVLVILSSYCIASTQYLL